MTTFRKTTGGYAFNIVSGAMVGRDPAIIAWIDSLPPLEPVVKTDSDPFTPSKICDEDRDAIRRMLGAIEPEATVHVVRRVVSELAEVKSRAASVTTDNMQLRAFFDEVGVMLGIKSRDGVTKGEIRVAIEALKSDVVRAGNACFDATARLQKMERELAEAKRQIAEATKAADKACEERDAASQAATFELGRLRDELSTLRAQRERMPAKLVEAAKSYLSSFGDRYLAIHGFGLAGEILRDLAACEPAAMLMVEEAVRVVHDVKRVIVRGTPIPNTVDTFDVEEALRKAVKS